MIIGFGNFSNGSATHRSRVRSVTPKRVHTRREGSRIRCSEEDMMPPLSELALRLRIVALPKGRCTERAARHIIAELKRADLTYDDGRLEHPNLLATRPFDNLYYLYDFDSFFDHRAFVVENISEFYFAPHSVTGLKSGHSSVVKPIQPILICNMSGYWKFAACKLPF